MSQVKSSLNSCQSRISSLSSIRHTRTHNISPPAFSATHRCTQFREVEPCVFRQESGIVQFWSSRLLLSVLSFPQNQICCCFIASPTVTTKSKSVLFYCLGNAWQISVELLVRDVLSPVDVNREPQQACVCAIKFFVDIHHNITKPLNAANNKTAAAATANHKIGKTLLLTVTITAEPRWNRTT